MSDPARAEETRDWLRKAGEDLGDAEVLLASQPPRLSGTLYHCQQSVEKALKGFLTWHQRPFRRTHDLRALRVGCTEVDASLEAALANVTTLTDYAWMFRYPGATILPTPAEAAAALSLAREVLAAIHARLPAEARL